MKVLNFTIIKLTFLLVLGIIFGYYFKVELFLSIFVSSVLILIFGCIYLISKNRYEPLKITGIIIFGAIFSLGILSINLHDQSNWSNHYTKEERIKNAQQVAVEFRISEILKPSLYHNKYFADIIRLDDRKVSGSVLININVDSLNSGLSVDDIVFTTTEFKPINKPLNPHQFDYSNYLKKKYVYHQIFSSNKELLIKSEQQSSILGYAEIIRNTINEKLQLYNFKSDELAIINAILLGQRKDLSKATYQSYASAGAIHILAVSGLHVGIILMILQFIFKPLERLKKGRFLKIILIVIMLWLFAIIAGLSPSVVRAVTMFSIVAIGMNLKRPTNIFNTLAISMFLLLLVKPMFIFDVGFQLSYLAVFAIVWIQPMLYKIWSPRFKIVDYFWQIFTVTIAAQIGVAPLSLFYFHQFPGLFFLSNLVIIPVLGFILGFGILVITGSILDILPSFIASFYGKIISLLNTFVHWVGDQEAFLFKGISFGIVSVIMTYCLFIFAIRLLKSPNYIRLRNALLMVLCIQSVSIYSKTKTTESFTVFNKSRKSLIAIQDNNKLKVLHNLEANKVEDDNTIKNYIIGETINTIEFDSLRSIYQVDNKLLLILDSVPIYNTSFKPELVLLRNSPKLNLDRLIELHQPELIIADGSNYKSYIEQWETTCSNKKLPFHATAKKGALIIEYAK